MHHFFKTYLKKKLKLWDKFWTEAKRVQPRTVSILVVTALILYMYINLKTSGTY